MQINNNEDLKQKLFNMKPEEVAEYIFDLYDKGQLNNDIIFCVEDHKVLLDNINLIHNKKDKYEIVMHMRLEDIENYINENGKFKDEIIDVFSNIDTIGCAELIFSKLNSESDKAKIMVIASLNADEKFRMLEKIDDGYYRNQVIKSYVDDEDCRSKELIHNINCYDEAKEKFSKIENEEDRAKFINTLLDYNMRLEFLKSIKSKENRNIVINGFSCHVDPNIKPQVEFAQKMIWEYFEDTLQEDFDEDKKERIQIIFNKADVKFKDLGEDLNGRACWTKDNIAISQRHKKNISRTLGFIIHEYGHLLSNYNFKTTGLNTSFSIEEGSCDLLGDLAINHYLEKYGSIELEGKKVRMDNPYETYSGYDFENAWQRTILEGLRSSGKDKKVFAEYILGDKYEYTKIAFGEIVALQKRINRDVETNLKEIYESNEMDFSNIDFNSIYAKRNFILSAFELQNRLNDKNIDILDCKPHNAIYIGEAYFDERKIYEISREEYREFFDLCMGLQDPRKENNGAVVGYDDFCHKKIIELSRDEIRRYSFEILDTECAIIDDYGFDIELEDIMNQAIQNEIELVKNGQPIEVSLQKYRKIIPDYLEKLDTKRNDSNMFIGDYIKDLQFAYIEQIDKAIEAGEQEIVINGLTDEETKEIYSDEDIRKVFSNHNIQINPNSKIEKAKDLIKLSKEQDTEIIELENQIQKNGISLEPTEKN